MTIAILGGGGHGRVVADCARAIGWSNICLFDDNIHISTNHSPWSISGTGQDLLEGLSQFDAVLVGIGSNAARLAWTRRVAALGGHLATLVHPHATVSPHTRIGAGSVVFAGAVVNIGASIGDAVIINTGVTVDHDCILEDGVHISPGAHLAGGVTVGKETWIGAAAVVRECIIVGQGVVVGAGAVVVKPIKSGLRVVGNPARPLER